MGAMAPQITSLTIVYSTVYSGVDKIKHQSSASLAFCAGNSPVTGEFPYKRPVTRKMFPFDDIMNQMSLSSTVFCTRIWLFAHLSKDMSLYVLHLHISANTSTYEYKSDLYVLRTCILSHLSVGIYLKRQTRHYCSLNATSSNKYTFEIYPVQDMNHILLSFVLLWFYYQLSWIRGIHFSMPFMNASLATALLLQCQ